MNGDERFVDVPRVTRGALLFFTLMNIGRSNLPAPPAHRFVGDREATAGKQFLDNLEGEEEPMGQLDGVTDDFSWNTQSAVTGCLGIRHTRTSKPDQRDNIMRREEID